MIGIVAAFYGQKRQDRAVIRRPGLCVCEERAGRMFMRHPADSRRQEWFGSICSYSLGSRGKHISRLIMHMGSLKSVESVFDTCLASRALPLASLTKEYFEPNASVISTVARNMRREFIGLSLCLLRVRARSYYEEKPMRGLFRGLAFKKPSI